VRADSIGRSMSRCGPGLVLALWAFLAFRVGKGNCSNEQDGGPYLAPTTEVSHDMGIPAANRGAWRWGICWLMFASTILNYMDRQTLALVGTQIRDEFGINNETFGWVLAAFSLSYAICQVPAGYVVDRWNARWVYAGAVTWWSLAGMAASFSPTLGILMICRALLGVGESFNWPCALRVTATVLPPADRSLGNGIFNSGAAVGAVLTPLIVPPLAKLYGWRTAFLVVGCLGFVWVVVWLRLLRPDRARALAGRPRSDPSIDPDALHEPVPKLSPKSKAAFGAVALLAGGTALLTPRYGLSAIWWGISILMLGPLAVALILPLRALKGIDWAQSLGEVVRMPRFWILAVVSVSINICWHFLVNWLPSYLKEDRGMTFLASGMLSSLPFLAADVGNLGGGAASRWLAARGLSPTAARMRVMAGCVVLISSGVWVGTVQNNVLALVLIGIMALGTAAFMANWLAFCQEVSTRHTGFIAGILGGLAHLVVAGFLPFAGRVKDVTGGFAPIFVIVGLVPIIGLGTLVWGWHRSAPTDAEPS
jgi:MFS transporter, ACS family, aldohexuronate transporter